MFISFSYNKCVSVCEIGMTHMGFLWEFICGLSSVFKLQGEPQCSEYLLFSEKNCHRSLNQYRPSIQLKCAEKHWCVWLFVTYFHSLHFCYNDEYECMTLHAKICDDIMCSTPQTPLHAGV